MMQVDFVIFQLHRRISGIEIPLLSNDFSERTCLASTPTKTFPALECRFDWILGMLGRDFHSSNFFNVQPFTRLQRIRFGGVNYMFPHIGVSHENLIDSKHIFPDIKAESFPV